MISCPSRAVAQCQLHPQQIPADDFRLLGEQSHIPRSCVGQQLTVMNEVAVPGGDGSMRLSRFEGGVSLPEGLVISLPVSEERRFHVKRTPVQKTPAAAGAFFY